MLTSIIAILFALSLISVIPAGVYLGLMIMFLALALIAVAVRAARGEKIL